MKNKGTTLVEIIISITLISALMIFIFGILVDLKQENKVSNANGKSSLERSSYTRVIQNDLIDDKLTGIKVCYEGQMCFKFTYQDKGEKIFKVENNEVIYGDEKWTVEDADFIKDRVQFVYKLATNEENLLLNSNANNYYLLKILIPDEDNVESNRKIDPEITNLGTGKLDIDCNEIINYLKGASYVECDGYQFESKKEVEDLSGHTVHLQLGKKKTINNIYTGPAASQNYKSKVITINYGQTTIKSSYGKNISRTGDNQEITLSDIKPGETVTITSTPSVSDSSKENANIGYTYNYDNTRRTQYTYTYGIEYKQLTGVKSKSNTTYTYTFIMPRYDVYLTSELTYTNSSKNQLWIYDQHWCIPSNVLTCVVGNPGDGPTETWSLSKWKIANGYPDTTRLDELLMDYYNKEVTLTDQKHGPDHDTRIRVRMQAWKEENSVKYRINMYCPDEDCHCVSDADDIDKFTDDITLTKSARDCSLRYWKDE